MSIRHDHDKYSANEAAAVNGRLIVTKPLVTASILLFLLVALSNSARAQNYALRWSDEFDGPAGSAPDQTKWNYDTGGGGWGNNELETYTNRTQNAFLDGDGHLVIKAIKETFTGADGIRREYTSARLLTKGKFSQRYGRFEARIKLPFGQGIWPAFWMLGANIDQVGWPMCGEMDIMENIGREPSINHGTLHGPGYSGGSGLGGIYTLPAGQKFSDDFHIFVIEWEPTAVRFYVDGNLYQTKTTADAAGKQWVFDHPFFILLNVAVGGNFPGNPNDTTTFPQTMTVDYVRVYADDRFAPKINSVAATRKDLIVSGENFDSESTIVMNGDVQKTLRDDVASGVLVGKKVAKKISSEQTVKIQVQNGDNQTSTEFNFTKP
jgi:beta-glucanase (GH16 family)